MNEITVVVKASKTGSGLGLYATKAIQAGDIILQESPLILLSPNDPEHVRAVRDQFQNIKADPTSASSSTSSSSLSLSLSSLSAIHDVNIPSTVDDAQRTPFRSMLLAAACYAVFVQHDDALKTKIQSLYAPPLNHSDAHPDPDPHPDAHETRIVHLSNDAMTFLKRQVKPNTPLDQLLQKAPHECQKIMLIWACNAFKGGLLYDITSRINHSCDFNAVISSNPLDSRITGNPTDATNADAATGTTDNNTDTDTDTYTTTTTLHSNTTPHHPHLQTIRAAADIAPGEEICISYLGSFTYADYILRNQRLIRDKFFVCRCARCESDRSNGDPAGSIPCPTCHPRQLHGQGRYLDEDVQYDDGDLLVQYCLPFHHNVSKKGHDGEDGDNHENQVHYKSHCKCGSFQLSPTLSTAMEKTIQRSMAHLDHGLTAPSEIDDDATERDTRIELTERLTCLATSVLGAKHWTTNLLTFVMLSTKLSALHATMLCKSVNSSNGGSGKGKGSGSGSGKKRGRGHDDTNHNDNDIDDEEFMSDIAECIDSLERVVSYLKSLKLKSHVGHLVGNVSIGVGRVLVGFGDVKSMKYGSTFVEGVYDDYFKLGYEGQGMEKVAETLMGAWKRKAHEVEDEGGGGGGKEGTRTKRPKT